MNSSYLAVGKFIYSDVPSGLLSTAISIHFYQGVHQRNEELGIAGTKVMPTEGNTNSTPKKAHV
jgi:hypothetical protein